MDNGWEDPGQEAPAAGAVEAEPAKVEKTFAVIELFGPTLQGEGPLAGSKTMFIRFGGCDYRCTKCDSLHAVMPQAVQKHAKYLTAQEICNALVHLRGESGTPWVTFSGGNPLMQKHAGEIVGLLHQAGFAIAVETQGTLWQDWLTRCQMVVISPKSPGMGEKFEPLKFQSMVKKLSDAKVATGIKVVIFSQQDIDFAVEVEQCALEVTSDVIKGMLFLSLGNSYPPELGSDMDLHENSELACGKPDSADETSYLLSARDKQRIALLDDYTVLAEDMMADPRLTFWRFLPQLHVLMYGNQSEK